MYLSTNHYIDIYIGNALLYWIHIVVQIYLLLGLGKIESCLFELSSYQAGFN